MANKVTIKTLAEELNLSVCTINKALNGKPRISPETRTRVLEAAERMGYRPNRLAQALVRPEHTIGVVYPDAWDSHYGLLIEGVRQEVDELRDHHIIADFHIVPGFKHGERFVKMVQQLADQDVNGMIICLGMYDPCALDEAWAILNTRRIPFVLLGTECQRSNRLAWVGIDGLRSGKVAGELLGWSLTSGSVAILVGSRENVEHVQKIEGFKEETQKLGLSLAGVYETGDDAEMANPVAARIFADHPDLAGLYIATENVEGVCQYLIDHDLAGKVKVIATGNSTGVMALIEQGVIQCSLFQNEQKQGRCAIQALKHWFEVNAKPNPAEMRVPPVLLIRNTMDQWSRDNQPQAVVSETTQS
jgi:LacI family transcriptional regulator